MKQVDGSRKRKEQAFFWAGNAAMQQMTDRYENQFQKMIDPPVGEIIPSVSDGPQERGSFTGAEESAGSGCPDVSDPALNYLTERSDAVFGDQLCLADEAITGREGDGTVTSLVIAGGERSALGEADDLAFRAWFRVVVDSVTVVSITHNYLQGKAADRVLPEAE